jgi:oligopeptide transport system ATP-binding protein
MGTIQSAWRLGHLHHHDLAWWRRSRYVNVMYAGKKIVGKVAIDEIFYDRRTPTLGPPLRDAGPGHSTRGSTPIPAAPPTHARGRRVTPYAPRNSFALNIDDRETSARVFKITDTNTPRRGLLAAAPSVEMRGAPRAHRPHEEEAEK